MTRRELLIENGYWEERIENVLYKNRRYRRKVLQKMIIKTVLEMKNELIKEMMV
jgi:hypothetical protein